MVSHRRDGDERLEAGVVVGEDREEAAAKVVVGGRIRWLIPDDTVDVLAM